MAIGKRWSSAVWLLEVEYRVPSGWRQHDPLQERTPRPLGQVDRVREDEHFMALLHTLVERDREILDRLAE